MRLNRILSLLAVAVLVTACVLPWLKFETRGLVFRGVDEIKMTVGTTAFAEINWGRPAYFHFFWAALFLSFSFIKRTWARWIMLGAAAFNLAWTVRNFFLLPACGGGDCPVKMSGLYLLPLASILLFIAASWSREDLPVTTGKPVSE